MPSFSFNRKPAPKPAPPTREQIETQLQKVFNEKMAANPDASIDEIVAAVKESFSSPPIDPPPPRFDPKLLRLIGLILIMLILAAIVARFLWLYVVPGGEATPTAALPASSPTAEQALVPAAIIFDVESPGTVAPGGIITLPLSVKDAGGDLVRNASLTAELSPPAAGTLTTHSLNSGSGGQTEQLIFTAGDAPGQVTITVSSNSHSDVRQSYVIDIKEMPNLAVGFKPDSPPSNPVRLGESFSVAFTVNNEGQVAADNVRILVDTPAGLRVESAPGCDTNDHLVTCLLSIVQPNSGGSSATIYYQAQQGGEYEFTPRVAYNGGEDIGGPTRSVTVESPSPASLHIEPRLVQVGADGQTPSPVGITVFNQWGEEFTEPARVRVDVSPGSGNPASDIARPLGCTVVAPDGVRLTEAPIIAAEFDPSAASSYLPNETPVKAHAFDQETTNLYVIAATPEGEIEGWAVRISADNQQQVQCLGNDPHVLPERPFPAGRIRQPELTVSGWSEFDYEAGTIPGPVVISANLLDNSGNPIGQTATAELELLEVGRLTGSAHLYNSPTSLDNNAIAIFQPGSVPVELYPLDGDAPSARQVAMRIWVPNDLLIENEAGELVWAGELLDNRPISTGLEPAYRVPATTQMPQSLTSGVRQLLMQIIGSGTSEGVDHTWIRVIGWVPVANIETGETGATQ